MWIGSPPCIAMTALPHGLSGTARRDDPFAESVGRGTIDLAVGIEHHAPTRDNPPRCSLYHDHSEMAFAEVP